MNQITIRPNKNRAIITLTLLVTMFLLKMVTLIRFVKLATIIKNHHNIINVPILTHDRILGILSLATTIIYITCIVYYILWFRRAYYNIAQFHHKLNYSNGWASGAWFIPLFHWIGPIQMMVELYKKTINTLIQDNLIVRKNGKYIIITLWWTFYIIAGSLAIYSIFFLKKNLYDYKSVLWFLDFNLSHIIINLILNFYAIWVVLNYYLLENKLPQISNVIVREKNNEKTDLIDDLVNENKNESAF